MPAKIEERLRHGAERKVYLNADARAKYVAVKKVLDKVRSAGVENSEYWSNNPTDAAPTSMAETQEGR